MDSWSVRGSVWAPACKRGCALRKASRPVDRTRRERHALLTGRDAKGTRRSRRRGVADHRRLVSRPRATHIPACMLAPSPASASGVSPIASIVFESTRPIFQRIRRIRRGFVLLKLFLYQPGIKNFSIVRNKSIRGVQPVAHNTNFDSFLVVKNVLCASSCTPRKQRNTKLIHNGTKQTHTTQIPS